MTLDDLLEYASAVPYDTNNAWGFGGGAGTKYIFPNGSVLKIGTASYRHMKSHKYATYYTTKTIIDVQRLTQAHIDLIGKLIRKHL